MYKRRSSACTSALSCCHSDHTSWLGLLFLTTSCLLLFVPADERMLQRPDEGLSPTWTPSPSSPLPRPSEPSASPSHHEPAVSRAPKAAGGVSNRRRPADLALPAGWKPGEWVRVQIKLSSSSPTVWLSWRLGDLKSQTLIYNKRVELWFWSEGRTDPASENRKHQLSDGFPFDPTIKWMFVTYGAYFLFSWILYSDITESRRGRSQHFGLESRSVQRGFSPRGRHDVSWKSFYNTYSHSRPHTGHQRVTQTRDHTESTTTAPSRLTRTSSWSINSFSQNQTSAPVFSAPSGLTSIRLISQSNEYTPDKSCSALCDRASVFWVNAFTVNRFVIRIQDVITALWALLGSVHLVEMFLSGLPSAELLGVLSLSICG